MPRDDSLADHRPTERRPDVRRTRIMCGQPAILSRVRCQVCLDKHSGLVVSCDPAADGTPPAKLSKSDAPEQ